MIPLWVLVLQDLFSLPPLSWYVKRQQRMWEKEQVRRSKLWRNRLMGEEEEG